MKRWISWAAAVVLGTTLVTAQETTPVAQLQHQFQQLQQNFERVQQEQRRQIELLQAEVENLRAALAAQPAKSPTEAPTPPAVAVPLASDTPAPAKPPWSPTAPITLVGGQRNYLNLSFDALFAAGSSTADDLGHLQLGGHDPVQRGFTAQNLETVFEGMVDPYFRGQASLVGHMDTEGEFHFEAEEAYLETLSLPWNLQVKAGQYLTEFGRINPTHPHTWQFADVPLVAGRFLGPEGLRNPGARVSWLVPTPSYSEVLVGVQNSQGGTAYSFRGTGGHSHDHDETATLCGRELIDQGTKTLGDMLYSARYAASFDLTDQQTLLLGASAAFGPNNSGTSGDTDTQIFGLDAFWKWKSPTHHGGFPFVQWQTEAMARRYEAGAFAGDTDGDGVIDVDLPRETLWDYGFYSQVAWGFRKNWVAAFRGDWVSGEPAAFSPDPNRDTRWRLSPNLTWYPTEFSKLRVQYNYDDRDHIGVDHSVWQVPSTLDRSRGDVHAVGNPHYMTDPLSALIVARRLADVFAQLDPKSAEAYRANLKNFTDRLNAKLADWQKSLAPYRGEHVVAYHNAWPYFAQRFELRIEMFLEPKPGLPPTPAHLAQVMARMKQEKARVISVQPYLNRRTAETVARNTGAILVDVTSYPGGLKGTEGSYIQLIDHLVTSLAKALGGH